MIGTSFGEWIFIRLSVIFFRYTPLIYAVSLSILYLLYGWHVFDLIVTKILLGLLGAETLFFGFIYLPYTHRLNRKATHPAPLSSEERWALFNQCMSNVQCMELYLRWWFLGAEPEDIRKDNLREFLLWGFFDGEEEALFDANGAQSVSQDLDDFVARIEQQLGRTLQDGRGSARCIRLTLDDIETTYRSMAWYVVIFFVDQAAHLALLWYGFDFYARQSCDALTTFPPRPQEIFAKRHSRAPGLSYWHRPHLSDDCLPVVFLHGIGVGLWTYVRFLADIYAAKNHDQGGGIGIIAIEILPVSFRLTSPPLDKAKFLNQMTRILDHHGWDRFTVASHSYGSVATTHMIKSPALRHRIDSVVLIDPVTIMLHLPDVAYNFTRRQPRGANEWQLWYFASTDPGVAHCLGRHFFWSENIIWKEELLTYQWDGPKGDGPKKERRVAVCLAGRDILLDTSIVAQYLTDQREGDSDRIGDGQIDGVEVVMFPRLDHAQVFDSPPDCERVVQLIKSYCST